MRVLVTGATGMLGAVVVDLLSKHFDVYATSTTKSEKYDFINYLSFDLESSNYEDLINWSKPDLIIHCAAITNGNLCENEPLLAYKVNGISVKKLLDVTDNNVKIIYISTDAVFPNTLHLANEQDLVSPESIYGKSKELGEFYLLQSKRNYTIIRTTIVGGNILRQGKSFAEWILECAKNNEKITLFDDVLFTPITTWDLATIILSTVIPKDLKGIVHIAGSEICSKYDFGIALVKKFNIDPNFIIKGSIENFKTRASRSSDQTLSTVLFNSNFATLPNLEETVNNIKYNYEKFKVRQ